MVCNKAILTKRLQPASRGARVKAWDDDGNSVTVPKDYKLDEPEMHLAAARALCDKMGWEGKLAQGGIRGGYAFVFVD
jgi:hypothetical protein